MGEGALRPRRRVRAWSAVCAIVALGAAATASPAMAVPGNFWGVVPQIVPNSEQFQRLKIGGVDSVRTAIPWAAVQPAKGAPFNWSSVDPIVAGAAAAGIDPATVVAAVEAAGLTDVEWYLRGPHEWRDETTQRLYVVARRV